MHGIQHKILLFCSSLMAAAFLFSCESKKTRSEFFDGEYPPLGEIAYTVDGRAHGIVAFEGQCILFFDDDVSQPMAESIIEAQGGKIVEQVPAFNYYLVKVVPGGEDAFVSQMRARNDVEYSFFNMPFMENAQIYIMDGFKDVDEHLLTSHGDAVRRVFSKYGMGKSMHCINLAALNKADGLGDMFVKGFKQYAGNNMVGELLEIAKNVNPNDMALINMSFGTRLYGKKNKRDFYSDVPEWARDNYRISYAESLKTLSACMEKMRKKGFSNFIVTKASGNDGYHNLDAVVDGLDEETLDSMKKNMVLVNACDKKKDVAEIWYSNLPGKKHDLFTTIDITPEVGLYGTSFAAPKLMGFIDKLTTEYENLNAQDVLQAIRTATPANPREPMTYGMLEAAAKDLSRRQCKQYIYILDMTRDYTGKWLLDDGKRGEIIKYRVHDTYGHEYLSGERNALYIENHTDCDLEIYLNAVESSQHIRPLRFLIPRGNRQAFYAYDEETLDIISVSKLEIRIVTR